MPAAGIVGDPMRFDEALLRAIDWALSPDEKKRPQSVAELRAVLSGLEAAAATATGHSTGDTRTVPGHAPDAPSTARTGPVAISPETLKRNVLGTVMFLDLVGYAAQPISQQVALKTHLNEVLAKALRGINPSTRVILDTSDGIATCFLGDPEEALQSALLLRDLLLQKYRQLLAVRIGLHSVRCG
jgi:hypothetical protein